MTDPKPPGARAKRGFAAMDRERRRDIASKGGRAAHQKGTAHVFTPEEASIAGAKGGRPSKAKLAAAELQKAAAAPDGDVTDSESKE